MACRFFVLLAPVVLVACGSKAFRAPVETVPESFSFWAAERERERVLPHLHYSLDVHSVDSRRGTVELSFYFVKEQGDSLLWVECVEQVPMSLVDTALCRRWLDYDR